MDKTERAAIVAARMDEIVSEENERIVDEARPLIAGIRKEIQPSLDILDEKKAAYENAKEELKEASQAIAKKYKNLDQVEVTVSGYGHDHGDLKFVVNGQESTESKAYYGYRQVSTIRPQDVTHTLMRLRNSKIPRIAESAIIAMAVLAGKPDVDMEKFLEM